jgi:hypothetical protein
MQGTLMIDATHDNVANVPAWVPKVAGYVTGTPGIAWTAQDWGCFPYAGKLRIDQSPALASYASNAASVADIESGAGTVPAFVEACANRLQLGLLLWVYCAQDTVAQVAAALTSASIPLTACGLWLANWNLSQAGAEGVLGTTVDGIQVVAVQWASPSSNPNTAVPNSTMTLAEANLDLSVTQPGWFDAPTPVLTPAVSQPAAAKGATKVTTVAPPAH